jgi:hypothetical protein
MHLRSILLRLCPRKTNPISGPIVPLKCLLAEKKGENPVVIVAWQDPVVCPDLPVLPALASLYKSKHFVTTIFPD